MVPQVRHHFISLPKWYKIGSTGTFPPGWDLTLRGMVVGERRRITLPYTLAYERKGVKDRGIPPFATMVYTVKLISLT